MRKGRREQVLHLVEEEQGPAVAGEQAVGEPQLLEPLAASRLVAFFVRLADAEGTHSELLGQRLAELGLAGARRSVHEHVHARSAGIESALQQPFHVVAVGGDVIEIRPFELARGRGAEQQVAHVEAGVAG